MEGTRTALRRSTTQLTTGTPRRVERPSPVATQPDRAELIESSKRLRQPLRHLQFALLTALSVETVDPPFLNSRIRRVPHPGNRRTEEPTMAASLSSLLSGEKRTC
jgi:hypothetical protein